MKLVIRECVSFTLNVLGLKLNRAQRPEYITLRVIHTRVPTVLLIIVTSEGQRSILVDICYIPPRS